MKITRVILGVVSLGALFWTSGCATLHQSEAASFKERGKARKLAATPEERVTSSSPGIRLSSREPTMTIGVEEPSPSGKIQIRGR